MSPYAEIFRRLSRPLEPLPTGVEPRLSKLVGIRAILFDVYGTLVTSASGDVGTSGEMGRVDALAATLESMGIAPSADASQIEERLLATIADHHAAARRRGIEYPEVEIADVWCEVFASYAAESAIDDVAEIDYRRLAAEYEARVNPVWPMPTMEATLATLQSHGLLLGIVSNAQFFTPELFVGVVGKSLDELGFDPRYRYYSYEHGQAKPGDYLYHLAAEALAVEQLLPHEVLYIGNDMRNDVWPAAAVGFRTALFAGDARSLRLRTDDPQLAGIEADAIVTELAQVPGLLEDES